MNVDLADTLEQLVDKWTLTVVLDALQEVCFCKAQHIAENWQDIPLSKDWAKAADRLDRIRHYASDTSL